MYWANIKDFPEFYHLDTLLITSCKVNQAETDSNNNLSAYFLSPEIYSKSSSEKKLTKYCQNNKNSQHIPSKSENFKLPALISQSPSIQRTPTHVKTKNLSMRIKNRLIENCNSKNQNIPDFYMRTNDFLLHLNALSYREHAPFQHSHRKTSIKKTECKKSIKPSPAFLDSHAKFSISVDRPQKKIRFEEKLEKINKLKLMKDSSGEKKSAFLKNHRINIPNYSELKEEIRKLLLNLSEMREFISNSKKIYGFLKNSLNYKKTILSRILLDEEHECIRDIINENYIEDHCFSKEIYYEGVSINRREKMDANVIADLKEINEKIESFNTNLALDKIKIMESEVIENFHKMKKIENKLKIYKPCKLAQNLRGSKACPKFNYKSIPVSKFVEEIHNIERNYGDCDHINNRSRMICQAIDNSLKNVRHECEGD